MDNDDEKEFVCASCEELCPPDDWYAGLGSNKYCVNCEDYIPRETDPDRNWKER